MRRRRSGDRRGARSSSGHDRSELLGASGHGCYPGREWCRKRLISRHIAARSRRVSPTPRSSSTRRSSTSTGSRGCTSRRRSCSSATRRAGSIEAFTPDFYLPDQDLYLEVTVMKQSLVTRKNRKLRKLRAALPGRPDQAVLRARLRAARSPVRAAEGVLSAPAATHDDAHRRGLPRRRRDPRARARARRRDRARLRGPRAAARRLAEGVHPVRRATSRARCRSTTRSTSSSSPATASETAATSDPLPEGPRRRDRGPRRRARRRGRSTPA